LSIVGDFFLKTRLRRSLHFQPQMTFGVQSIDRQTLYETSERQPLRSSLYSLSLSINNTVALAKSAKIFNVPTIFTYVPQI
jgi:hypothetical protein